MTLLQNFRQSLLKENTHGENSPNNMQMKINNAMKHAKETTSRLNIGKEIEQNAKCVAGIKHEGARGGIDDEARKF